MTLISTNSSPEVRPTLWGDFDTCVGKTAVDILYRKYRIAHDEVLDVLVYGSSGAFKVKVYKPLNTTLFGKAVYRNEI